MAVKGEQVEGMMSRVELVGFYRDEANKYRDTRTKLLAHGKVYRAREAAAKAEVCDRIAERYEGSANE